MNEALAAQLAAAELDDEVRCVVLTGAGKGFCAGGDVKGMAAKGDGTVGRAHHRPGDRAPAREPARDRRPPVQDAQADDRRAARRRRRRRACRWRWPATCGSWPAPRSSPPRSPRSASPATTAAPTSSPSWSVRSEGPRAVLPVRPRERRRGAAAGHRQLGVCAPEELAERTRALARRLARRPGRRLPVHEGEPEPRDEPAKSTTVSTWRRPTTCTAARPRITARRPRPSSTSASRCSRAADLGEGCARRSRRSASSATDRWRRSCIDRPPVNALDRDDDARTDRLRCANARGQRGRCGWASSPAPGGASAPASI